MLWSLEGQCGEMLTNCSSGNLAPILLSPALQDSKWLLLRLLGVHGLSRSGMNTFPPCRNCPGLCCELLCFVLQGSALMHFYLLEEARATEPALSLGAGWSSGAASALGLLQQQYHCRELRGHLRDGAQKGARWLHGAGGTGWRQLSMCCSARQEQAVKGGEWAQGLLQCRRGGRVTAI